MKQFAVTAVLGVALVAATAVTAADNPIASRQTIMKNVGASMGGLGKMAKGELEFDAVTAEFALRTLNVASHGYGELFPEGSDTGAENRAAPEIWSDRAGFDAEIAKLQESTGAAVAAPPTSVEELGQTLASVGDSCKTCHEGFRLPAK